MRAESTAFRTLSRRSTTCSLAMQVMHQAAVKLMKTGRPSARKAASRASLNGCQTIPSPAVVVAVAPASGPAFAVPGAPLSAYRTMAKATKTAIAAALRPVSRQRPEAPALACQSQAAKASRTAPASAPSTAASPACNDNTQTSQAAVANIGKARNCLKRTIHGPGFGIRRSSAGAMLSRRNGRASPRPSASITAIATAAVWPSAKPTAAPMKGAVQGVATMTASTPVKKEPPRPDRPASAPPIPAKRPPISNRPAKFSPISTMR